MITLEVYMPPAIQKVLGSSARYKVLYGGRGSAKSWAATHYCISKSFTMGGVILCAREYWTSIKDSVYSVLKARLYANKLDHLFYITNTEIVNKITGCTFKFIGLAKNINNIKSIHDVRICYIEEAESVTRESWVKLIPSIRAENSEIIVVFNPEEAENETYQRFVVSPEKYIIDHKNRLASTLINYYDNTKFPEVLREEMKSDKSADYELYEHTWLGKPKKFANALIFRGKYKVEEFNTEKLNPERFFYGADWGFSRNPTTLNRFFIYDKCLYIEYEANGIGVELDEIPQLFRSVPGSEKWEIKADNARPETISFVKNRGFNIVAAAKWPGSVEDGIAYLRSFEMIIVHPRCQNTIKEFGLYKYKTSRSGKTSDNEEVLPVIVDKHNHHMDGIRYGLCDYIKEKIVSRRNIKLDIESSEKSENIFRGKDYGDW